MRGNKGESEQVKGQIEKKAMGDGKQPARCILSLGKHFIEHARTHAHGGTSCRVLSILLLAPEAITALCTNYSALSRKCVVGKATQLTTLLIKTCQQATCVLSMCAGIPPPPLPLPAPNTHPIPTGGFARLACAQAGTRVAPSESRQRCHL